MKRSFLQKDVTAVNIYAPGYLKQLLMHLKGDISSNVVIEMVFNTLI